METIRVKRNDDFPKKRWTQMTKSHPSLRPKVIKTGIWPFRKSKVIVICNCGWQSPDPIPILKGSGEMLTKHLVRTLMEQHIVEDAMRQQSRGIRRSSCL